MEPSYILVIEDDDIVARTIERSLRGSEFRVLITNSGVEGLKAARRRSPDLVILDIIMPGWTATPSAGRCVPIPS